MRLIFQSTCPARGTTIGDLSSASQLSISIHVPREGHDRHILQMSRRRTTFQSTCPARGTTSIWSLIFCITPISIHVPREGHDFPLVLTGAADDLISIHVPREGHDWHSSLTAFPSSLISIHVPREGHDHRHQCRDGGTLSYFNPRAPRGARRSSSDSRASACSVFQSTCPARGTTLYRLHRHHRRQFQSTCPARGTTSP